MRKWRAIGVSAVGARHAAAGAPSQDAVDVYVDDGMVVVAAADGHGDPRHSRSEEGARIAVEVCTELLSDLGRELLADKEQPHAETLQSMVQTRLPRRISWEWNRRVKAALGMGDEDGVWHADMVLFGTTVLGALFARELGVFIQLGDGDIVLVSGSDGDLFSERVFEEDPDEACATITRSLCERGSAKRAQVMCREVQEIRLALVSTDGVRDSMDGEIPSLLRVGEWFFSRLRDEGWENVTGGLGDWLSEVSLRGNGDDSTIGIVHWSVNK